MLKKVEGIIISETNFKETSKIIKILTKDGIISCIAKGAKSIKSPLRSFTTTFTYASFNIYYHEDKLSTLTSADSLYEFKNIKKDINYFNQAKGAIIDINLNKKVKNIIENKYIPIEMLFKNNKGKNEKIKYLSWIINNY